MSLADFDERDLDLLADYLAEALDEPAAAQVRRRLDTDPTWAAALAELGVADLAVRAQLSDLGRGEPTPIPADVAARVDAALAAEPTRADPQPAPVISLDAARQARRRRLSGLAAAAVAVVAVGTGALVLQHNGSFTETTTSGSADSAAVAQGQKAPTTFGAGVSSSGRDYTAATLGEAAAGAIPAPAVPGPSAGSAADQSDSPKSTTGNLASSAAGPYGPLTQPDGIAACLAAVTAQDPGAVESVDLARYRSAPAVIIVIRQSAGQLVVAAGPSCGVDGADVLATARP